MIPKIIHQTWISDQIPAELEHFVYKVKKLNPDWQYILWTDDTMLKFVTDEFPDFLPTWHSFPKNIMRADAFRYLLMYKLGGVYLDLDYEVLQPFNFEDEKVVLPYNKQIKDGDTYDSIGNCFLVSEPNHIFWFDVIDNLKKKKFIRPENTHENSTMVEETTGPEFLTRVFYHKSYPDISNPDRVVYHPKTPKTTKQQKEIEKNGVSLGIHHCVGSWRDKSIKKQILTKCRIVFDRIFN